MAIRRKRFLPHIPVTEREYDEAMKLFAESRESSFAAFGRKRILLPPLAQLIERMGITGIFDAETKQKLKELGM